MEQFNQMLLTSRKILSKFQLELLQLSLSLRTHSPKLELFRQIGLDRGLQNSTKTKHCPAVVDVNGHLICSVEELSKQITSKILEKPIMYDMDHHYPGGESNMVCFFNI